MADDSNNSIGWFIAGLGLGALVGVMFAPKAGSETREYVAGRANEGADYLKNSTQQAKEAWGGVVDKSKEYVDRGKQQVQSAFDAGRRAYQEKAQGSEPEGV
ncbi:MAG: hypothetical protein NVS9B15_00420 [Acidobacteriaceae bacterium]